MRAILTSIGALLLSTAVLLAGGGLLSTLVAIRAEAEGFSLLSIGLLTSGYYAGFIGGCLCTPYLVKRVGHVRVFAALSAMTAAAALTHVLAVNMPVWFILRVVTGFSLAGLYVLIESWINEQAPNDKRGQVLSIYRMVDLGAVTAGQFMLTLADPKDFALFSVVAICVCVAIFPISLSTSKAPVSVTQTSLNLKKLIMTSPVAVAGSLAVGLANGTFWGVAPVFVQQLNHPVIIVSTFMSSSIAAGALLQWPVGWMSDRLGRRVVMVGVSVLSMCAGVFLWQFGPNSQLMLLVGGTLYGAFAMQIFGLAAAHANDFAKPNEFVAISGGLLLLYGIGSVIGPSIAPILMTLFEPSAMFAFTAVVHAMLAVYVVYRISQREAATVASDYVSVARPRSMMMILRTDPRNILKRKKPRAPKDQA